MHVLVTGASGLLGWSICTQLNHDYQLTGTYNQAPPPKELPSKIQLDIRNQEKLKKVAQTYSPDVVIHCAANTSVDQCEKNRSEAMEVNLQGTINLIKVLPKKTKFIYISSDAVFDGNKKTYTESDTPNPLNIYGHSKLKSEEYIRIHSENYLILRTNFFGYLPNKRPNFIEWLTSELNSNKPIRMITDWFFSPIYVNDLVATIGRLIKNNAKGTYHVGGSRECSKYQFAIDFAKTLNLSTQFIIPTTMDQFSFLAKRPKSMVLDSGKVQRDFNIKLPTYLEGIEKLSKIYVNR